MNNFIDSCHIISAFCGTGKTYICKHSDESVVELECWKYNKDFFPDNYFYDIRKWSVITDTLFISTDKRILDCLTHHNIDFSVIYPKSSLKNEYMERFKDRRSHQDFMDTLDTYWYDWIHELDERMDCDKYVLDRNEYITNIFPNLL